MPSLLQRLGLHKSAPKTKNNYYGAQAFMLPAGQPIWMRRDYHKLVW